MAMYAVNTLTLGITEYEGLSLEDLMERDGRLYGVATGGLMEFTGPDDDGTDIDAYITSGKLSFDTFFETRASRAYIKDQYANALTLTTLVDEVDAEEEAVEGTYVYSVPGRVGARQHAQTIRLRRDVKGTSWQWKLANVDGGGMVLKGLSVDIESIEVDV